MSSAVGTSLAVIAMNSYTGFAKYLGVLDSQGLELELGVLLVVAVLAALVWVMVDRGWISLDNPSSNTWIALVMTSIVLAIGMYWGILWRRLSGQLEVDDEDNA